MAVLPNNKLERRGDHVRGIYTKTYCTTADTKNVSARDMSLTLGQNESYINQIENRKALPSLQGLFYICEYFGITPRQFFDEGNAFPVQLTELVDDLKELDATTLSHISAIARDVLNINK